MEKCLEKFYQNQKQMLEQLKFLTLNLNGAHAPHAEDQVSLIENNVIRIYNESVTYVHTINKVMEIGIEEASKALGDILTDQHILSNPISNSSREEKERSNISAILNQEEDSLLTIKIQMNYICERLCQMYKHSNSKTEKVFGSNLEKAAEALKNNRVIEGAQWLQAVLYDPSLDQNSKAHHSAIIEEARSLF